MVDFTFTECSEAVEIVNDALTEIKQSKVTAAQLDAAEASQTDPEERASSTFMRLIDIPLKAWGWKSIEKQTTSALTLDESRLTGAWYVYSLPSDYLRLNQVLIGHQRYNPKNIWHKVEQSSLLLNFQSPYIRYNYKPTTTGYDDTAAVTAAWNPYIQGWSAELREAVVMYLQSRWATSLKRDEQLALQRYQMYEEFVLNAKLIDGSEESVETQDGGPLVEARMGYFPYGYGDGF